MKNWIVRTLIGIGVGLTAAPIWSACPTAQNCTTWATLESSGSCCRDVGAYCYNCTEEHWLCAVPKAGTGIKIVNCINQGSSVSCTTGTHCE